MDKYEVISPRTGLIESAPSADEWIFGSTSRVGLAPINVSKDWSQDIPSGEPQKLNGLETFSCVSQAHSNVVETIINYYIRNSMLPAKTLRFLNENGYIGADGKLNLSDRFLAKMSGTTKAGNYITTVSDTLRRQGALPENDWAFGKSKRWDEYYKTIPQELVNKAKTFNDYFEIHSDYVSLSWDAKGALGAIKAHLAHTPLLIAVPICSPWNTDKPVRVCGKTKSEHAVVVYNLDDYIRVLDSYDPYTKRLPTNYYIPWVRRITISIIKQDEDMFGRLVFNPSGDGRVFLLNDETKTRYHIKNEKIFASVWGAGAWGKVGTVTPEVFASYKEEEPFGFESDFRKSFTQSLVDFLNK